jgi:hypothetical protein
MEEIVNKWKSLGFLDNIDEILARKIALVFEKLSLTLLNGENALDFKNPYIETIAFPIFRKILIDIDKLDANFELKTDGILDILMKMDTEVVISNNEERAIAMSENAEACFLFSNKMIGLFTKEK